MWSALSRRRAGLTGFLAVVGPGLIAANAGNDAGGIATYASVGAAYGYGLLWMMVVITISLAVVQEMCARMGAMTGKGLTELIRENFGVRWVLVAVVTLFVANALTTISELAGVAAALELFGVPRFASVVPAAVLVWLLVVRGSSKQVEKVFLAMTLAFFAYPISAMLAKPDWGEVLRQTIVPRMQLDTPYIFMFVATVGTTITPYMQVYVQSAVAEKGVTPREYRFERLDVYLGSLFSNVIAFFIIVATGATLYRQGTTVETAGDAARALEPLAGMYATDLFAVGLLGASLLAAAILPLATAYSIGEALGFERGVSFSFDEARPFMALFTGLIVVGAIVTLIPGLDLIKLLVGVQVVNGLLLPVLLLFIIRLVNDRSVMGDQVNGPVFNVVAWLTVSMVILLSLALVASTCWAGSG